MSLLSGLSQLALSLDEIIAIPTIDKKYIGHPYEMELLNSALDATEKEYGPYLIKYPKHAMESNRVLYELEKGENLSIAVSAYKSSWEGKTLIVPVPLRKGMSSFRLFFASIQNKSKFDNITNLEQLKAFKYGQGHGWSTEKILRDHGFQVVYPDSYSGLFRMLLAKRYDLFMRGAHEIFHEKEKFYGEESDLYIEDRFVIYTYLPTYFNVTKKQPLLAERLEKGLKIMYKNNELDRIFNSHYSQPIEMIKKAKPKIFYLENTNLKPGMYERDKPFLLNFEKLISESKQ